MAECKSKGIAFPSVLVNFDDTLVKNLDVHKVVEAMNKNKSLPKQFRMTAKAAKKAGKSNILLSALKEQDLFAFAVFLEAVQLTSGEGNEKHYALLNVISPELRHVILPTEPQTEEEVYAVSMIKRILHTHLHPAYAVGKTESKVFTSSGGIFYSETHGVKVTISGTAMAGVPNFRLIMNASLHGPHQLPPDIEICSPFISLICTPLISEFSDEVEVEIPHCVFDLVDPEQFSVLIAEEEYKEVYHFHEDPNLEFDVSDFSFKFLTKHFTSHVLGRKRSRRGKRTSKRNPRRIHDVQKKAASFDEVKSKKCLATPPQTSPSVAARPTLEHSASAPSQSEVEPRLNRKYLIVGFSPRDKNSGAWRNVFFVCQHGSTGYAEVQSAATKYFNNCGISELEPPNRCPFSVEGSSISFVPEGWDEGGWSGHASSTPAEIDMDDVLRQAGDDVLMDSDFLGLFPPRVEYGIQIADQSCQPKAISLSVENATRNGKPVAVAVFPPSAWPLKPRSPSELQSRCIYVTAGLHKGDGSLCQSILSHQTFDYTLQLDNPNTIKFLAEISLQLFSNWKRLALMLQIPRLDIDNLEQAVHCEIEACFLMLYDKWLMHRPLQATVGRLLESLRKLHIEVELVHESCTTDTPIAIDSRKRLLLLLPIKIAARWKFIARLLGMAQSKVENIDSVPTSHDSDLVEKSKDMLEAWLQSLGDKATYLPLYISIQIVNQYTSKLTDAVVFMQKYLPDIECQPSFVK